MEFVLLGVFLVFVVGLLVLFILGAEKEYDELPETHITGTVVLKPDYNRFDNQDGFLYFFYLHFKDDDDKYYVARCDYITWSSLEVGDRANFTLKGHDIVSMSKINP